MCFMFLRDCALVLSDLWCRGRFPTDISSCHQFRSVECRANVSAINPQISSRCCCLFCGDLCDRAPAQGCCTDAAFHPLGTFLGAAKVPPRTIVVLVILEQTIGEPQLRVGAPRITGALASLPAALLCPLCWGLNPNLPRLTPMHLCSTGEGPEENLL